MKRTIALLMALLMCLACLGCGQGNNSAANTGNNSSSGQNSGSTAEVEKTSDWQTAAEAMNAALPDDFGWMWQTSDANTPPVMVKKE